MDRLRRIEDAKENQLAGQTVSTAAVCPYESRQCVSSRKRIRVPRAQCTLHSALHSARDTHEHRARTHARTHICHLLYVQQRRDARRRDATQPTNPHRHRHILVKFVYGVHHTVCSIQYTVYSIHQRICTYETRIRNSTGN